MSKLTDQLAAMAGKTPPAPTPPVKNPTAGFNEHQPYVDWWKANADSFRGPAGLAKAQALMANPDSFEWKALVSALTTEYPNPAYTGRGGISATLDPLYKTDPSFSWWYQIGAPSLQMGTSAPSGPTPTQGPGRT